MIFILRGTVLVYKDITDHLIIHQSLVFVIFIFNNQIYLKVAYR